MKATIRPSSIAGIIRAPASKSSMQRALAAALVAKGKTVIHNPGQSNDDKAAIGIIKALGAGIEIKNQELVIMNNDSGPSAHGPGLEINCGESGLSIRMFTPLAALREEQIIIHGEGSLRNRPLDFFDALLPQLGVKVESNNGKVPLKIKGPLQPRDISVDGSLSSQFLTGLLMAYSAAGAKNVTIKVKDLKSKPYIDLTLEVMRHFGLALPENKNYEEFYFSSPGTPDSRLLTIDYTVEGDWSGAAFLLVAAAIAGPVSVTGLDMNSTQADKKIMDALYDANASVAVEAKGIKLRPAKMMSFEFDATDCPDLFPPLVALACYCTGTTNIKGVSRLIHKESNRAVSLQQEFAKMGVRIELNEDVMIIHGSQPGGATVSSHHDHRIAMACAVAALKARGEMIIEDAEAINKSYPDFFDDLKKLGADVSLSNKLKYS